MAVYKLAKQEGNKKYSILGGILIPITIAFLVFLILPMFSGNVLAPETYALMIAWSIIGLIYFNHIIRKDHTRKFGKAILVWVSLLAFVVILSLTWSQRMNEARENAVIKDISFIRNAFGETRDVRMIELIIDIADYLHVPVVAEGVETEEQYMALKALGCDYVQGYYFSRPVPPADFDRFLIERGEQGVEIAPDVKRTYVSISKALTSDYENIYFVDVVSNHYLEFFSVKNGDLEIRPGGTDFFGEAKVTILEDVSEDDVKTVGDALSKSNLVRCAGEDETFTITFKRMKGGTLKEYTLQTIKTRSDDKYHIVIGVK